MTMPLTESSNLSRRQREILDIARARGTILVEPLAQRFGVTSQTVRRDLNQLSRLRLLQRIHGGAVPMGGVSNMGYAARLQLAAEGKAAIGRRAAALIPNDASLIVNIGTTTEQVAHNLSGHVGLTVITNNLNVVNLLRPFEGIEVMSAGGILRREDGGIVGDATVDFIGQFKVDHAIIGASAIEEGRRPSRLRSPRSTGREGDHRERAFGDPRRRRHEVPAQRPGAHRQRLAARLLRDRYRSTGAVPRAVRPARRAGRGRGAGRRRRGRRLSRRPRRRNRESARRWPSSSGALRRRWARRRTSIPPISFLQQGVFNVLLGATLSGKTTLMRLMAGLDKPSAGRILFRGEDVTGVPVQKRNVSMVYQQSSTTRT